MITVCREGHRFTEDDLELLRSLADRATLAMANVKMHHDLQRQAVTDDLTGLATHGHFLELLDSEVEGMRRYHYPVGLIRLDLDNFKSVNDDYGHQQGDLVLRYVADVLRATSRDVDIAARYGGEELALILPHTDLAGAPVRSPNGRGWRSRRWLCPSSRATESCGSPPVWAPPRRWTVVAGSSRPPTTPSTWPSEKARTAP